MCIRFHLYCAFLFVLTNVIFAQRYDPLFQPDTYRSDDNPYYWKNRKPYDGYWQQDVHYNIKAVMYEKSDLLSGTLELTYWNNSPYTLDEVYFHLYQNAFQPGSYFDNVSENTGRPMKYGHYGEQQLGTVVSFIKANGRELKTEYDNTIIKVFLDNPLKSGDSITFFIEFKTYFEEKGNWRRMSMYEEHGFKHYNGGHWYPRIAMYDRKFGWITDQHLGKEFNGDYGTYDVELTFANNFIVEGTGNIVNREEMLPSDLRSKLDISNFLNKPWGEEPSIVIPFDPEKKKTWIFHAENVHDFCFTADPTYRIGEVEKDGITAVAMVQEQHAMGWHSAARVARRLIDIYSRYVGEYAWHKIVVADARQGMEYPMITLDSEFDPYYKYLFAHEIGHQWFFGMVGSNETYRAFLDEGFTQFLTVHALKEFRRVHEKLEFPEESGYLIRYKKKYRPEYESAYYPYLDKAIRKEERPLNTHSDDFESWYQYRLTYYKGTTMLINLQYVLGDSLFRGALRHYFEKWKFCHPYPEDFRQAVIEYTQTDLNWFFDQWLETTKTIDYAVKSYKRINDEGDYRIVFKRKGEMQMPVDFVIIDKQHTESAYHIPNTWFVKKTDATVLPKWFGWDKLNPEYTAVIRIPEGIRDIRIDTTYRMADINRLNNSKKFPKTISFDSKINNLPDWKSYEIHVRPALWYNGYDGIKAGIHYNGDYMRYRHLFSFTLWMNSGLFSNKNIRPQVADHNDLISCSFSYQTPLEKFGRNVQLILSAGSLDGLQSGTIALEKKVGEPHTLFSSFKTMYRRDSTDLTYLLYPDDWVPGIFNNTINLGYRYYYSHKAGSGNMEMQLRSSAVGSGYNFSTARLTMDNRTRFWKLRFYTRAIVQYGSGTDVPPESALYLAGASPEEMMDNRFTRSTFFLENNRDNDYSDNRLGFNETTGHFHHGGGLNLRGYSGYLAPETRDSSEQVYTYRGLSGAAVNAELELSRLVTLMPKRFRQTLKMDAYLFGDAGMINMNDAGDDPVMACIRADAGAGIAITVKKWGKLEQAAPLTVRFDMPLFLSRPPYLQEYFEFRWMVGVSRAF